MTIFPSQELLWKMHMVGTLYTSEDNNVASSEENIL